jgi:hypothetical protein
MKAFRYIVPIVIVILVGVLLVPVTKYPVRENIVTDSEKYQWEMWCHTVYADKFTVKRKVATFTLTGEDITADSYLQTDLCD